MADWSPPGRAPASSPRTTRSAASPSVPPAPSTPRVSLLGGGMAALRAGERPAARVPAAPSSPPAPSSPRSAPSQPPRSAAALIAAQRAPVDTLPPTTSEAPPPSERTAQGAAPRRATLPPALGGLLRTGAALAVLAGGALVARPRVEAAWKLRTQGPAYADYSLCMVGPKGPTLLREGSPVYAELLRRRLLAAAPEERPFERCAALAGELGGPEHRAAHLGRAEEYVEFGTTAADAAAAARPGNTLTLAALELSLKPLAQLARDAWPLMEGGYLRLVQPGRRAFEAVHPVELPAAGEGSGLPAWRAQYEVSWRSRRGWTLALGAGANLTVLASADGGRHWTPAPQASPGVEEHAERCAGPRSQHSFAFGLSDDAAHWMVTSLGPDGAPLPATAAPADARLLGASCDDGALVAAFQARDGGVALLHCVHRGACSPLTPPPVGSMALRAPLDVARLGGTTVVAMAAHGIVRVVSSRDDGRTWTPWSVAWDGGAATSPPASPPPPGKPGAAPRQEAGPARERAAPSRLLVLDQQLLLHGTGARAGDRYPLLVSDDQGASWRTP